MIATKTIIKLLSIPCLVLTACQNPGKPTTELEVSITEQKAASDIIPGVNAYSFAELMLARDSRDEKQVYSLFNLLDWCATQNIKALDPTGYFFPSYPEAPSDEYIEKFKRRASELGIAISGTGIRNNFASPGCKGKRLDRGCFQNGSTGFTRFCGGYS